MTRGRIRRGTQGRASPAASSRGRTFARTAARVALPDSCRELPNRTPARSVELEGKAARVAVGIGIALLRGGGAYDPDSGPGAERQRLRERLVRSIREECLDRLIL